MRTVKTAQAFLRKARKWNFLFAQSITACNSYKVQPKNMLENYEQLLTDCSLKTDNNSKRKNSSFSLFTERELDCIDSPLGWTHKGLFDCMVSVQINNNLMLTVSEFSVLGEQRWRSDGSACLPAIYYGSGSIPEAGVMCGLNLLLVLVLLRGFFSESSTFLPSTETRISELQFDLERRPTWKPALGYGGFLAKYSNWVFIYTRPTIISTSICFI